jgi:hypothetical protein
MEQHVLSEQRRLALPMLLIIVAAELDLAVHERLRRKGHDTVY